MNSGQSASGAAVTVMASSRKFYVRKKSELRVEVEPFVPIRVRLHFGTAEIFGTELPLRTWLSIPPYVKFAIFTWTGAMIELEGNSDVSVSYDTPMLKYWDVHDNLDRGRARAKAASNSCFNSSQGPRVIVIGHTDSGKCSVCKMLLSWACKQSWKPTFVDLDIGQQSVTIPGCIAATPVEMPIDAVEGIPLEMPIVYFYGHTSPSVNAALYRALVKELSRTIERQLSGNAESRAAGMVINTIGWATDLGYELLLHAIDTFNPNLVLVVGQEKLCITLKNVLRHKPKVEVMELQKSGDMLLSKVKVRQKARNSRIREYFYGILNDLSPHLNTINFRDISVYWIGNCPRAPRTALPLGAEPAADPTQVVPVKINLDLLHQVLAVSYAKEPQQILSSNVAGFVYVTNIDIVRKKITYLAPCPGELPSRLLVVGSLTWLDS